MPSSAIINYDPDQVVTWGILEKATREIIKEEFLEFSALLAKHFEELTTEFRTFRVDYDQFKEKTIAEFRDIRGLISDVMGELQTIRDEVTILAYRSADHNDRLEKLEKQAEKVN